MNQLIREDLLSDETIIWSGQPGNKIFSSVDLFLIPFSILWGGFSIFWETMVLMSGGPAIFFAAFGIPFVLMGLYMLFGRFFYKSYIRRNTYYFITNKRIIILKDTNRRTIEAEYINTLPAINKKVNTNGEGSIIFGNSPGFIGSYAEAGMGFMVRRSHYGALPPTFYDLDEANKVYKIVSEIRNGTYIRG